MRRSHRPRALSQARHRDRGDFGRTTVPSPTRGGHYPRRRLDPVARPAPAAILVLGSSRNWGLSRASASIRARQASFVGGAGATDAGGRAVTELFRHRSRRPPWWSDPRVASRSAPSAPRLVVGAPAGCATATAARSACPAPPPSASTLIDPVAEHGRRDRDAARRVLTARGRDAREVAVAEFDCG